MWYDLGVSFLGEYYCGKQGQDPMRETISNLAKVTCKVRNEIVG